MRLCDMTLLGKTRNSEGTVVMLFEVTGICSSREKLHICQYVTVPICHRGMCSKGAAVPSFGGAALHVLIAAHSEHALWALMRSLQVNVRHAAIRAHYCQQRLKLILVWLPHTWGETGSPWTRYLLLPTEGNMGHFQLGPLGSRGSFDGEEDPFLEFHEKAILHPSLKEVNE